MNNKLLTARYILFGLMIISVLVTCYSIVKIIHAKQVQDYIEHPEKYQTPPNDLRATFTQALQLEKKGKHNPARQTWTNIISSKDAELTPLAYVNRGNIQLRSALKTNKKDQLLALAELAKIDYRSALSIDPELWPARYNLEVALRLATEDPRKQTENGKKYVDSRRRILRGPPSVSLP